jgi:hypothetical protein
MLNPLKYTIVASQIPLDDFSTAQWPSEACHLLLVPRYFQFFSLDTWLVEQCEKRLASISSVAISGT